MATWWEESVLVGDEAADTLLEYAATLARQHSADALQIAAIGSDGDTVVATFLLDSGTSLAAEISRSSLPEPDNSGVIRYMLERIRVIIRPARGLPFIFGDQPDYDPVSLS